MYVSVFERLFGGVLGVYQGWLPLPTRLQQYCDPASLVLDYEMCHHSFITLWHLGQAKSLMDARNARDVPNHFT